MSDDFFIFFYGYTLSEVPVEAAPPHAQTSDMWLRRAAELHSDWLSEIYRLCDVTREGKKRTGGEGEKASMK